MLNRLLFHLTKRLNRFRSSNEKIRKLPYPYKAGFAISNDVEFMSFDFFETLMEFLNTNKITPLGHGLNLNITSSVFFYSNKFYNFSYFDGLSHSSKKSKYADRILEYLKSGWIDTNHAYGDFDGIGGFTRRHAEIVLEEMLKNNIKIPCFTNHGDIYNIQNVGRDASYHKGDVPNHEAYHADLFPVLGTKYIWTDSNIIEIKQYGLKQSNNERKKLRTIMMKDTLQDGQEVYVFRRFRSTGCFAPNLSSFRYQLEVLGLNEMYKNNELIILYQHLGTLYKTSEGCVPATIDSVRSRMDILLSPFYLIEKEYHEGRLWVAGLSDLLRYIEMLSNIEVIEIDENIFEIHSKYENVNSDFFQGLTIYVNPQKPVKIRCKSQELAYTYNGPDETGQYSVTIPIAKRESIW